MRDASGIQGIEREVVSQLQRPGAGPVVTAHDLAVMAAQASLQWDGTLPALEKLDAITCKLVDMGLLTPAKEVATVQAYWLFGQHRAPAEDVLCALDPFAYVSHLSAMDYYGLTDRLPTTLYFSTPPDARWRKAAQARVRTRLGAHADAYLHSRLPKLHKPLLERIAQTPLISYASAHLGAFKHISNRAMRVSTAGRTFVDMLREPRRCGGIRHVAEVYAEHGGRYLDRILDELRQHGSQIERARAGYLLEERASVRHSQLDEWAEGARRGGSRKLDATADYDGEHISTRWCISVNL